MDLFEIKKESPRMEAGVGGSLRILDTIRGNDQLTYIGDPLWKDD